MQLLPLTNVNDAHTDFVKSRLNGQDTTGDASQSLLPADQGQHSPESAKEKKQHYEEMILSRWPYIAAGCIVFLLLSIGLCIWRCCCRRGKRSRKAKGGVLPAQDSSYMPLHDPGSSVSLQKLDRNSYSGNHNHGGYGAGGHYTGS